MPPLYFVYAVLFCLVALRAQDPLAFDREYEAVQQLVQKGQWAKAKPALDELLARHQGSVHAIAHREAIVEDMRRCCFGPTVQTPKPETLVTGKLASWNPATGRIKLVYTPETLGDFEHDKEQPDTAYVHPAAFRGDYTITWRGEWQIGVHIAALADLRSDSTFYVSFGAEADDGGYYPTIIEQRAGEKTLGAARAKERMHAGPYTVTLRVAKRSVEITMEGKKVAAKLARPEQPFGHFGFFPTAFGELVVEGEVEPSWLQGLVDKHVDKQRETFDAAWAPSKVLPKWLFENPSGAATAPKWDDSLPGVRDITDAQWLERVLAPMHQQQWLGAMQELDKAPADGLPATTSDFLRSVLCMHLGRTEEALTACDRMLKALPDYTPTRLVRARVLEDLRRPAEALTEFEQIVAADPGDTDALEGYVVALLQRGRVADAEAAVRRAKVQHGLWDGTKGLDQMLTMRRRGPGWQRRHTHLSTHFDISSDIDLRTCQQAAQILEAALVNLKAQLAWTDDRKSERFRVFLFSGEAGYKEYCSKILGSAPSHTAGLYTPVLKQLLIWNVPKREDMERTIRHEGFHQFLDRVVVDPPVWFNEGMAEFWERAQHEEGRMRGGQPRPEHVATLIRARASLPKVQQLLQGTRNDFYANAFVRYPQAWALVHFLRTGPREYQQRFTALWQALRGSGSTREAVDKAFAGVDWAAVDRDFWSHVMTLR